MMFSASVLSILVILTFAKVKYVFKPHFILVSVKFLCCAFCFTLCENRISGLSNSQAFIIYIQLVFVPDSVVLNICRTATGLQRF